MANSNTNPQIRENYSPLNTLVLQAIRRYGDFHPGTVDGDVMLMFLEFANQIIDEIRMHPYHDGSEIDYYQGPTDVRAIPDPILVQGFLYHYAVQQGSEKLQMYMPMYNRTLNQLLWNKLNGNTKIQMKVVDDGTNKRNLNGGTVDENNGTVSY
jgi:hypothetical protein